MKKLFAIIFAASMFAACGDDASKDASGDNTEANGGDGNAAPNGNGNGGDGGNTAPSGDQGDASKDAGSTGTDEKVGG